MTSSKNPSHMTPNPSEPKGRVFALQIVAAQVAVTCVISLLALLFSHKIAIAILYGGMICSLANCWLAIVAFRPVLGKPPGEMLAAFYVAEIGKFVLTAMLFIVAFKKIALFKQPNYALILFLTYASVQSVVWAYPLARSKVMARLRR